MKNVESFFAYIAISISLGFYIPALIMTSLSSVKPDAFKKFGWEIIYLLASLGLSFTIFSAFSYFLG